MPEPAPTPILTLDVEHKGDLTIVYCHGKLIAGVGDILYSRVCQLLPDHKRIILDFTDLAYLDSMGLGTLVRVYVSSKSAGCRLELVNLGKRVRELMGITHMLGVFSVIGEQGVHMKF
jgi:anti-sigma B factor antagonist